MLTTDRVKSELWVGRELKRKEDVRLLTGKGNFVDDFAPQQILYSSILRSPHPHARINKIDTSKALKLPGVRAVITGQDALSLTNPLPSVANIPAKDYCLAIDKVRYVGEPVAAVAAESRYIAEDALELIEVEYDTLPAVMDAEREASSPTAVIHEKMHDNVAWRKRFTYGNVEEAFREADFKVKERFHFHRFSSTPLEPYACIAHFDESRGTLTFWDNHQSPAYNHSMLPMMLRFPSHKMRFIQRDSGGSFGVKLVSLTQYMTLIGLLTLKTRLPVKWIETRTEHLTASEHGNERFANVEAAVKRDGTITAIRIKSVEVEGAYLRPYEPVGAIIGIMVANNNYKMRNFEVDASAVLTNRCPVGPNRGYGRMQHCFMIERIVDRIARELGIDRVELRMKNFIQPDEFPYETPSGSLYDSGDYPQSLQAALKALEYERWQAEKSQAKKQNRYIGIGLACVVESGGHNFANQRLIDPNVPVSGATDAASVRIDSNGKATVFLGESSSGQGHETIVAQIVADELGLTPEDIHVVTGFDYGNPYSGLSGTFASKFAVIGVGAVVGAARKIREKVLKIASHKLQREVEQLELKEGRVTVRDEPSRSVSISEIAFTALVNALELPAGMEPGLFATHFYSFPHSTVPDKLDRGRFASTFANNVHAAVVEVDPETGVVKILKYVVVHDCGRRINPTVLEGQVHGATALGIAASLYEAFRYDDDGHMLTSTFIDYMPATPLEIPDIEVVSMETPSPFSMLGSKGSGEGGGTPPIAIASAIEDALTDFKTIVRDSHHPPETVLNMMRTKSRHNWQRFT